MKNLFRAMRRASQLAVIRNRAMVVYMTAGERFTHCPLDSFEFLQDVTAYPVAYAWPGKKIERIKTHWEL